MRLRGLADAGVVVAVSLLLTAALTYPLVFKIDRVGRVNTSDGLFSLWTVAWVAHALTSDPGNLFNANIFYPSTGTLAFSEANLVAGAIGAPAWALTGNPYLTHNVAVVFGFVASFAGTYYLAHYLTGAPGAAWIAAVMFAFCPFVFARTAHIQLLLTFGLPWSMLAFHRLADQATVGRSVVLGVALWVTALSCAYYGIFAMLMVGFGTLLFAWTRRLWRSRDYWIGIALAALVSIGLTAPFFLPYRFVQQELSFSRTLDDSRSYSAGAGAWLASPAWAHRWWLPAIEPFNEVLFPGIITTVLGSLGMWIALRRRARREASPPARRDVAILYVTLGLIAFWASFGPDFGLYTVLFNTIPVFSFLRAPARMGIITTLSLTVLAAVALASWPRITRRAAPTAIAALLVAAELSSAPLRALRDAPPLEEAHRALATLPPGPVAAFPYFHERWDWPRHSIYLLKSTAHWRPLINGYGDHIPAQFRRTVRALSTFPSRGAFAVLRDVDARYVVFHLQLYDARSREILLDRLATYREYLRPIVREEDVWLFEIVGWPN